MSLSYDDELQEARFKRRREGKRRNRYVSQNLLKFWISGAQKMLNQCWGPEICISVSSPRGSNTVWEQGS